MVKNCRQVQEIQKVMIGVDGSFLYHLGASLHPLVDIRSEQNPLGIYPVVFSARYRLNAFLHQSVFRPKTSYASGNALLRLLDGILDKGINPDTSVKEIGYSDAHQIQEGLRQFEAVLAAEFGLEYLYLVYQKGGYDNKALIENATVLFPDDLTKKVPEAVFDIEQAGRCIAFELATAAGFHLHRVNEAVLHRYYDAVTKGKKRPDERNIGVYITKLEQEGCSDAKLIAALKALKDFHRNPLIHPDQSLESIHDAIALLNGIHTVVVQMLKKIPEPEEATASESEQSLNSGSSAETQTPSASPSQTS